MKSGERKSIGRNYSLDCLRILSMFGVVILHAGSHGGVLAISEGINAYTLFFHGIEALAISSVNVFVLISAYFLCAQSFRLSRLLKLWSLVLFYSLLGFGVATCLNPEAFSIKSFLKSVFPISYSQYWFVSAYIIMCLLSPLVNYWLKGITQLQHFISIILLLSVFCLWPDLMVFSNPSGIKNVGSSAVWFVVLYIVAAYFRKWPVRVSLSTAFAVYFMSSAAMLAVWAIMASITNTTNFRDEAYGLVSFYYFRYNSLLPFIATVSLFWGFRGLTIKNNSLQKAISLIAPLMLGVYLIHDNGYFRDYVWSNLRGLEPSLSAPFIVMGHAVAVFVLCAMADAVRTMLFSVFGKRTEGSFMNKVDAFPDRVKTKLEIFMINWQKDV